MTTIVFEYTCPHCPGTGIVRPARPGIDWPVPCSCGGRKAFTQYQLGRMLGESHGTIARLNDLRATPTSAMRIFWKLFDLLDHGRVTVR